MERYPIDREFKEFYSLALLSLMNLIVAINYSMVSVDEVGYKVLISYTVTTLVTIYMLLICTSYAPWCFEYKHTATARSINLMVLFTTLSFIALTASAVKITTAMIISADFYTEVTVITMFTVLAILFATIFYSSIKAASHAYRICCHTDNLLDEDREEISKRLQSLARLGNTQVLPICKNNDTGRIEIKFSCHAGLLKDD